MNADIIIADDDRVVRASIADLLVREGYSVRPARDGEEAVRLFLDSRPDLVLLDVMMPVLDGFSACRRMRETSSDVPILFLSALGDEESQLRAFGYGADDYVVKTLPASVLLARIGAALRRAMASEPAGDFDFASWRIDASRLSMHRADGATAVLTEREVALLRLFAAHPREVLSREWLMARLWGVDADVADNLLNVVVHNLREKLGGDAHAIRAIRGVGYSLSPTCATR